MDARSNLNFVLARVLDGPAPLATHSYGFVKAVVNGPHLLAHASRVTATTPPLVLNVDGFSPDARMFVDGVIPLTTVEIPYALPPVLMSGTYTVQMGNEDLSQIQISLLPAQWLTYLRTHMCTLGDLAIRTANSVADLIKLQRKLAAHEPFGAMQVADVSALGIKYATDVVLRDARERLKTANTNYIDTVNNLVIDAKKAVVREQLAGALHAMTNMHNRMHDELIQTLATIGTKAISTTIWKSYLAAFHLISALWPLLLDHAIVQKMGQMANHAAKAHAAAKVREALEAKLADVDTSPELVVTLVETLVDAKLASFKATPGNKAVKQGGKTKKPPAAAATAAGKKPPAKGKRSANAQRRNSNSNRGNNKGKKGNSNTNAKPNAGKQKGNAQAARNRPPAGQPKGNQANPPPPRPQGAPHGNREFPSPEPPRNSNKQPRDAGSSPSNPSSTKKAATAPPASTSLHL